MNKSKAYQPDLVASLRNAGEAEEYLNAALEEGEPELFLLALRNVAEAQGGVHNSPKRPSSTAKAWTRYSLNEAILNSKASMHSFMHWDSASPSRQTARLNAEDPKRNYKHARRNFLMRGCKT